MPSLDLSPDQVSAARESWVAAGNSAEEFDRAIAGAPEPEKTPAVEPELGPALSEDQIRSARADWVKAGLDAAAFDAAMGTEAPREVSPEIVANLTEHALEPDHIPPSAYKIDWLAAGPARELSTPELVALNTGATEMLSEMHLAPGLAEGLIEYIARQMDAHEKMSEPERGLWRSGESYKYKGGLDEFEAAEKKTKEALLKLSDNHPFAVKLSENRAVVGSVYVQKTILFHAEKVAAAVAARSKAN